MKSYLAQETGVDKTRLSTHDDGMENKTITSPSFPDGVKFDRTEKQAREQLKAKKASK